MIYICDWTHWQGTVCPAGKIEEEGFRGIKLKAGGAAHDEWSFIDPTFHESAEQVQAFPGLQPLAYWYLVPGKPIAQAGLFVDLVREVNTIKPGGLEGWGMVLDVEQEGLTHIDVHNFLNAYDKITNQYPPIIIYTNRTLWEKCTKGMNGRFWSAKLEEAHWVPQSVRHDPETPYASQQVKAVPAEWRNVNYGGWKYVSMIQFTDYALVAGKRVPCSAFYGNLDQFRSWALT